MLFAHLRFSKFSPSLLREAQADWTLFREYVSAPVFAYGEIDDDKFSRFVHRFGFKPLSYVVVDGESRRLFLHLKD